MVYRGGWELDYSHALDRLMSPWYICTLAVPYSSDLHD